MAPKLSVVRESVRKICQLTGERDYQTGRPAFNSTETRYKLFGTDLGTPFEHDGKLWFLFGDTWPTPAPGALPGKVTDSDAVAWSTDTSPDDGLQLNFVSSNGRYLSPVVKDQNGQELGTGSLEVPVAGFSANNTIYVFFCTNAPPVSLLDGGLATFWIGPDGRISYTFANPAVGNGIWHPPYPIAPAGAARHDSHIAAITRTDGALDVFWIGPDGGIGTTWSNPRVNSGKWGDPFSIAPGGAARPRSPIAAITRHDGALDVFWIGPDGGVGTNWCNPRVDNGRWQTPFAIAPAGAARQDSPIAAITRNDGALDVFWVGPNGGVGTTWSNPRVDNGRWHTPFAIAPGGAARSDSPIAAITRHDGALDVFWIGPDGGVGTNWCNPRVDNGRWHTPFAIAPGGAARSDSPIAAITRHDGALDIFWVGSDGGVGTTWSNPRVDNGRWHTPFAIASGGAARPGSPIAAITRHDGALDVFWIGPDGGVGTTWSNPRVDNGRWHTPFAIAPGGSTRSNSPIAVLTGRIGDVERSFGRTVLARSVNNNPVDLRVVYDMSLSRDGGKFIILSCSVSTTPPPLLPFSGEAVLAWGTGKYRLSNPYFACIPVRQIENRSAWRYFGGISPSSQRPIWSPRQSDAVALFDQPMIGELSVSWIESLGLWLMLYNAGTPRGINGRVALNPWGPWSDVTVVFDPGWPGVGYGHFIHRKDVEDGLSDLGRMGDPGGEYAPCVIDRFTRPVLSSGGIRSAQIFFVMSTWNPYNTVFMTALVSRVDG